MDEGEDHRSSAPWQTVPPRSRRFGWNNIYLGCVSRRTVGEMAERFVPSRHRGTPGRRALPFDEREVWMGAIT